MFGEFVKRQVCQKLGELPTAALDIENAHCILHGEKCDQRSKATVVLFEVVLTTTVLICHVLASNLATPL
jgi:hypothetical protein